MEPRIRIVTLGVSDPTRSYEFDRVLERAQGGRREDREAGPDRIVGWLQRLLLGSGRRPLGSRPGRGPAFPRRRKPDDHVTAAEAVVVDPAEHQ